MTPFGTKTTSSDPSGWPKDLCADSSLVLALTQAPVAYKVCSDDTSQACEVDSDCSGTCDVSLYDYGSLAEFRTQVDNSMAGLMRDCAECHVGGGAQEFVVAAPGTDFRTPGSRISLRNFDDSSLDTGKFNAYNYFIDQYDEDNDGVIGEVLPQNYDETGVLEVDCFMCHLEGYDWEARKEAIRKGKFGASRPAGADFIIAAPDNVCSDDTSVTCDPANGDADCVLAGYCQNATPVSCTDDSQCWADFGSGPVFLGPCVIPDLGTCISREPIIDGTNVTYDSSVNGDAPIKEIVNIQLGLNGLYFSAEVLGRINEKPHNDNCASCHFAEFQADWKKRGASWPSDVEYASLGVDGRKTEVHRYVGLGCVDCHAPFDAGTIDGNLMTERGGPLSPGFSPWTGIADDTLGHDVAKAEVPYGTLWNALDNTMFRCRTCHLDQIYPAKLDTNGTPPANPNAPGGAHETYGLLHNYLQDGRDGVADASHIDVMACDVCHTRKFGAGVDLQTGLNYGNASAMVDGTGVDDEGRLFDHESIHVQRLMENNLVRAWQGDLLTIKHGLVTMFWRDVDEDFANPVDITKVDINADGQSGFMDQVKSIDVAVAMATYDDPAIPGAPDPLQTLTHDGVITGAEIDKQREALEQYLPTIGIELDPNGTGNQQQLRLTFMGMLFRSNHGTSPKEYAWGHGGCLDCHQDGAGFYNGTYQLKGDSLTLSWDNTGDQYVVPFTRVNHADLDGSGTVEEVPGDYQFTDFDPLLMPKGLTGRTLAIQVASGSTNTLRDVDRSEFMYEADSTVAGAPGPRTMVSGAVLGTRAEIVNHLNNVIEITFPNFDFDQHQTFLTIANSCLDCHVDMINFEFAWGDGSFESQELFNAGQHATHFRLKNNDGSTALTCTDCHDSIDFSIKTTITVTADLIRKNTGTTDTDTWNPQPTMTNEGCNQWAIDNADGIPGTADDYICIDVIDPVETGRYTCATACHPDVSNVTPGNPSADASSATGIDVTASIGALHSINDNDTITINAQRSSCTAEYDSTCEYTFDYTGCPDGAVVGGNGSNVRILGLATEGVGSGNDCTVSVNVLDSRSGEIVNSGTVTVAFDGSIDPEGPQATLSIVGEGSGNCTVSAADAAALGTAVRARIYWGNRESQIVEDASDLIAPGVTNDCGADVRVKLYDADHNTSDY